MPTAAGASSRSRTRIDRLRGPIRHNQQVGITFQVLLWMDLLAFAVPGLGVVLIGYVASMMQGERAELTKRRLEAEADANAQATLDDDVSEPLTGGERPGPDDLQRHAPDRDPIRITRQPARVEVRRLLKRHGDTLTAERVKERTGVSIQHARKLLRQERELRVIAPHTSARPHDAAEVES